MLPTWDEWDKAIDLTQPAYDALEQLVWRRRSTSGTRTYQLAQLSKRIVGEIARLDDARMMTERRNA